MSAPVIKVVFSMNPVLEGKCILCFTNKDSHTQLIRAIGRLTENAVDIIGWLNVLINKNPVILPNYIHNGHLCTLFLFDPKHISLKMIKTHLMGALDLMTDEHVTNYINTL